MSDEIYTPWQIIGEDSFPHIHNAFGECIAADVPRATAELIVRAVNGESELVIALQTLGQYAAALEMMLGISEEGLALTGARAAIAKARS